MATIGDNVLLLGSAARTVSGLSAADTITKQLDQPASAGSLPPRVSVVQHVTAASGTSPTLNSSLEGSYDDGATWTPLLNLSQATAAGLPQVFSLASAVVPPPLVRIAYTIAGTSPSFTFSVRLLLG